MLMWCHHTHTILMCNAYNTHSIYHPSNWTYLNEIKKNYSFMFVSQMGPFCLSIYLSFFLSSLYFLLTTFIQTVQSKYANVQHKHYTKIWLVLYSQFQLPSAQPTAAASKCIFRLCAFYIKIELTLFIVALSNILDECSDEAGNEELCAIYTFARVDLR